MSNSLLDWILDLLRDPPARAEFRADPDGYAADHGFPNLTARDVNDALNLIADSQAAGYDRGHRGEGHLHYAPPHELPSGSLHGSGHGSGHGSPHGGDESGARYLNQYVTNNFSTVEEHNTNIDNSVHQYVDTGGGDFDQVIDNDPVVGSGDGAVAVGGDLAGSTVTSGDGNVVGDGNHAVTGQGNTTAFGSGGATDASLDDVRFGDGAGLALGGAAAGADTDNNTSTSVHSSGSGDTSVTAAGAHGEAGQYADQGEHDNSTHSDYQDNSSLTSHDEIGSHHNVDYSDSHNVDAQH